MAEDLPVLPEVAPLTDLLVHFGSTLEGIRSLVQGHHAGMGEIFEGEDAEMSSDEAALYVHNVLVDRLIGR